ncbi:MAG TPA: NAD-dependent DNA ligase LigA [Edaphocola sp.]|nr:NAD-dependent DNA ligase LigA [Edaphocola sp.]
MSKSLLNNVTEELKSENAENYIAQLRAVINYADWKYYIQDNPVLADQEYDRLFKQLKTAEEQFPQFLAPDSPTQRIAKGLSDKFPTIPHLVPMLSLENSYNEEDLREWDKRCKSFLPGETVSYTVEPKYDGAGISLYYENDLLQRGVTRGDGIQGEDITPNIRQIKAIPLSAPFSTEGIESIEIRGEVIIPKKAFEKYNNQRLEAGLALLANPRNAASGTLRMLDPTEISRRGLHAVLYHVSYMGHHDKNPENPQIFNNHYNLLRWLYQCGFSTPVKDMKICVGIEEVIDYCREYEVKRDDLPFEIDGMVIKVNSLKQQEDMGQTTHHPRWAMAFKFKARQATSKLLRAGFQVGRTGTITPVAKIEPVALGGVTISSVSLFNEDIVREKDLRIGDQVLVERAGDVIPYIVKPLSELRTGTEIPIQFPDHCPECGEVLIKPEGEAAWRCMNMACPAQVVEHLIHYASKDAMDIRNLGEANIRRFYDLGWLRTVPDIYRLDFDKIRDLPKMGPKSAENLETAIEASKRQPLPRLIFGLGIRFVGETTARTLATSVQHIFELKDRSVEQLCQLEDIGPKVAASVYQFFHIPENLQLLSDLAGFGVNLQHRSDEHASQDGLFRDKTFLFTGTLSHFKRSEAEAQVEAQGGKILNGVSSKLHYLVVGADAGSKLEKAKKLGNITILKEEDFLALLKKI